MTHHVVESAQFFLGGLLHLLIEIILPVELLFARWFILLSIFNKFSLVEVMT